ncbi:hypothetical protein IX55_03640 [Paracoccus sanguinis]|nr:hypothetical protein IX55_03640 [Paracoccus sanguinis]
MEQLDPVIKVSLAAKFDRLDILGQGAGVEFLKASLILLGGQTKVRDHFHGADAAIALMHNVGLPALRLTAWCCHNTDKFKRIETVGNDVLANLDHLFAFAELFKGGALVLDRIEAGIFRV